MQETEKELINQFYSTKYEFSYSSLNKLIYSPTVFYNHYILKKREDTIDNHLVEGKAVHCLLLDEKMFDSSFIVAHSKIPTGNSRKIVESIYLKYKEGDKKDLSEFESEILEVLTNINLHQKLKTDNQRLEKVLTQESKDYFKWLMESQGRGVITLESLERCKEAVEILSKNNSVSILLGSNSENDEFIEVYNEKELHCSLSEQPFGLKGILDNLVIDYINKRIYINDLKTTSKSLVDFSDTIEHWNYWMQAAIYLRLARCFMLENNPDIDFSDWKILFHFIVIDKYNQVYPFPVTQATMQLWQQRLDNILKTANYHYVNKDYSLPFEFAQGKVLL